MDKLIAFLEKNWEVVREAPLAFAVFFVLACALAYWFASLVAISRHSGVIETLQQRLLLKDEQMAIYKSRLDIRLAETASIAQTANKALRQKALTLVGELRAFLQQSMEESQGISMAQMRAVADAKTEEEKNQVWHKYTDESLRRSFSMNAEYDRRFKAETILLRDEIVSRLPTKPQNTQTTFRYEHPTNPIGMEMVATDLELLAKRLPD